MHQNEFFNIKRNIGYRILTIFLEVPDLENQRIVQFQVKVN